MRKDRAEVFSNTKLKSEPEKISITKNEDLPETILAEVGTSDIDTVEAKYIVDQPRNPLHPEVIARIKAAKILGVRVLKDVPRIGAFKINDQNGDFYLANGEGDAWIDKIHEVTRAIEDRGLGAAQVKALGQKMASDPTEEWFRALDNAKDTHQKHAVQRAFSEWADGDAIAAHIAYGLDIFCSEDIGNSNATNSILAPTNRAWLTATYGVQFMTFDDLMAAIP